MRVIRSFALVALALAACSSGDGAKPSAVIVHPPAPLPSAGGRPLADAGPDADAGRACTGATLGGASVTSKTIAGVAPEDVGGTLVPGTYDLSDIAIYAGIGEDDAGPPDAGPPIVSRATIVVTASELVTARADDGGAPTITIASQHVDGVSIVTSEVCPGNGSQQIPFTADASTLRLHVAQSRVDSFVRRP